MDKLLYRIILASLLHDIGKVYERAGLDLDPSYIKNNQELYQPNYKGRFTHRHVLYSVHFIERMRDYMPSLFLEYDEPENSLINLAGKHHKPETPEQYIIAVADRLSSGFERIVTEEKALLDDPKKTPLLSVFEDIDISSNGKGALKRDFKYCYRLKKLTPENIFPVPRNNFGVGEKDYQDLISDFERDFKELPHKDQPLPWLTHLESLIKHFFSFVPSATVSYSESGDFVKTLSDISLYDHAFLTSALASALYLYHQGKGEWSTASIKDEKEKKFLFLEGNFYGIQKFIFSRGGETNRYAAKLLRGRSFMISLMCELCAHFITEELGLTPFSVLFNTAGKFLILAPNLHEIMGKIKELDEKINRWLYQHFYGETSIGLVFATASPEAFIAKAKDHPEEQGSSKSGYKLLLETLGKRSAEKKFMKVDLFNFGGVPEDYFEKFSGRAPCELCGKRPQSEEIEDVRVCKLCWDHVKLGENLVKKDLLVIYKGSGDLKDKHSSGRLRVKYFDRYEIALLERKVLREVESNRALFVWDIGLPKEKSNEERVPFIAKKFINAYVPLGEQGIPLTFEELAKRASREVEGKKQGVEALGVLKMDMDNGALIFHRGFPPEKQTFSRYLALSRGLDLFFSYYVPYLCQRTFRGIYNVFTGGDDLFVVGPWDEVLCFAKEINERFKKYTCLNEAFSLSAGYVITKPHLPVYKFSDKAEAYLKHTKTKDKKNRPRKRGITLFGVYVPWREFEELENLRETLEKLYTEEILKNSHLYKLNEITEMVRLSRLFEEEEISLDKSGEYFSHLHALTWPSKLYYFTVRNLQPREKNIETLEEILKLLKGGFDRFGEKMRVPIWQIIYKYRRV